MLRKNLILAIVGSTLLGNTLSAQSNSYSLKAYSNFGYSNESKNEMFYKNNLYKAYDSQYDIGYFSPALTISKSNGSFHEIEISRLKYTNEDYYFTNRNNAALNGSYSGVSQTSMHVALRYEYANKFKFINENSRISAFLGLSGSPYYRRESVSPHTSDLFPESQSQIGLQVSIVPRITYNINENWFLDLNVPISVVDAAAINSKSENPTLQINQRETSTFEISLLPQSYVLRFGLGLRI